LCKPGDAARDVVDSTYGIIFLGTPHQGSPISSLGTVAARVTGFLGSRTGLLLSLASYRAQLSDLDVRFVQCMKEKEGRRQKTEIVAFCEEKPTRMLGWLSVGLVGAAVPLWRLSNIPRLSLRTQPEAAMLPKPFLSIQTTLD
jgi:hypothetical protein